MITANTQKLMQEKLKIKEYSSAIALKETIRAMIARRSLEHWELCGMKSVGAYLSLTFISQQPT